MNRIEFDSICLKQRFSPSYRETMYQVLRVIVKTNFPIGIMQISLPNNRSHELFSMLSVAFILRCRGTWLIELVEKMRLRPPLFFQASQPGYSMV